MTKGTYKDAKNKKKIRDFLFSFYTTKSIIGLPGPDIGDYIKFLKDKGYSDIELWENNISVLGHQLTQIKTPLVIKFGNILNAVERKDTLLDLDYCATVRSLKDHVKKFKSNFIMTFSLRAVSYKETTTTFFKSRKEKVKSVTEFTTPFKHEKYKTDKGTYIIATYRDSSPMCTIAKIK
jgi:hypothetical protein